jgi:signal transduction histidine kinase
MVMDDAAVLAPDIQSLPVLLAMSEVLELGVVTLDRDLIVTGWSRWLAAVSELAWADVVGRPLFELFPELRGTGAEAALRGSLEGATTIWAHRFHQFLLPFDAPAGYEQFGRMQQSARIMPVLNVGAPAGVIVLLLDVTERVAREEELRAALQRAEAASQSKSEFLASMSHELRTPLSAVVGYMELFEGDMLGPVAPEQKRYLKRVKAAARHLISIIEEILTFSRIDAGKEEVHREMLDVVQLARDVEELLEPQAVLKGLALSVTLPDRSVLVDTDPTKLRQILINLLGNALKFTDEGAVSLEMSLAGGSVNFCIRDSGPGIDAADLERIFDPFTQVDQSLKRRKGGTGLGLPVSRRLADLLGGSLSVESSPGTGTAFTLRIPITPSLRMPGAELTAVQST